MPSRPERALRIGGFQPFSTVDYPGRIAAVVFCQGCPWRCRYCHNPHLQPFDEGLTDWETVEASLAVRRGFLDAVVFSGGEPTAQAALVPAMRRARALGFGVGLHTAGMYPDRLRAALPHADWVGFDVKAPFDAYEKTTAVRASGRAVEASLRVLLASGVAHELRTTVHPLLLDEAARDRLARQLRELGARPTRWQGFRPQGCADEELNASVPRDSAP